MFLALTRVDFQCNQSDSWSLKGSNFLSISIHSSIFLFLTGKIWSTETAWEVYLLQYESNLVWAIERIFSFYFTFSDFSTLKSLVKGTFWKICYCHHTFIYDVFSSIFKILSKKIYVLQTSQTDKQQNLLEQSYLVHNIWSTFFWVWGFCVGKENKKPELKNLSWQEKSSKADAWLHQLTLGDLSSLADFNLVLLCI